MGFSSDYVLLPPPPSPSAQQVARGCLKERIRTLLKERSRQGITEGEISRLHRERFDGTDLDLSACGLRMGGLVDWLVGEADLVSVSLLDGRIIKMFPTPELLAEFEEEDSRQRSVIFNPRNSVGFYNNVRVPSDVYVGPNQALPRPELPADLSEYLELIVSEMADPRNFFVQLRQTQDELEQMMDELDEFYCDPATNALALDQVKNDIDGKNDQFTITHQQGFISFVFRPSCCSHFRGGPLLLAEAPRERRLAPRCRHGGHDAH